MSRLFRVHIEVYPDDSKEIVTEESLVTGPDVLTVAREFHSECEETGGELVSVSQVGTVVRAITATQQQEQDDA